jgi:hypothetical protein
LKIKSIASTAPKIISVKEASSLAINSANPISIDSIVRTAAAKTLT